MYALDYIQQSDRSASLILSFSGICQGLQWSWNGKDHLWKERGEYVQTNTNYADKQTSLLMVQEFFFVPYSFTDVNDEREIHKGDEVSFYMAKNKR